MGKPIIKHVNKLPCFNIHTSRGRDTIVGIASRYRLEGSEFERRWEQEIFSSPYPSRSALLPNQPSLPWLPAPFWEVNRPERGVGHPAPCSTEVMNG